jgi:hypothetical protein|uniref:hypothetical protein n=1 Tax=Sphingomonas bacterium TaxID=1895847 RepID=UPI002607EF92|nr:hypothetical protein [Sphingomonas bacterium]
MLAGVGVGEPPPPLPPLLQADVASKSASVRLEVDRRDTEEKAGICPPDGRAREIIASRFQATYGSKRAISLSVAPDLALSPPDWRYSPPADQAADDARRPVHGQ